MLLDVPRLPAGPQPALPALGRFLGHPGFLWMAPGRLRNEWSLQSLHGKNWIPPQELHGGILTTEPGETPGHPKESSSSPGHEAGTGHEEKIPAKRNQEQLEEKGAS